MAIITNQKGSSEKLSANFRWSEFDCHGTGCCDMTMVDETLVKYLQRIRDHFGARVTVTSGYRCPEHNDAVSHASKTSKHMQGMAADIVVEGVKPAQVAAYAESIGILGIGLYETAADGFFVHIDTRDKKSFWYGQSQEKRQSFCTDNFSLSHRKVARGDIGEDVRALQLLLSGNGQNCTADGIFGRNTEAAVAKYQQSVGIASDCIAGERTMARLMGVDSNG